MERVPILKIGDILLVSIQVDMSDQTAIQLQEDLAERIVATGCHGVIIDITALDIVDSFVGRMLSTIASISKVLDAETVVVGMRPAVAITLVELGLSLNGIRTALNVERGMELIAASRADEWDEARRRRGHRDDGDGMTTGVDLGVPATQAIRSDEDVVRVRQLVRTTAVAVRLSLVDQTKLVTAASELARNTLIYGGGGSAEVSTVADGRRRGVRILFADEGPGIPDLDLALTDGYTTGGGLGLGLSGARRLVDDFDIQTAVGEGTRITVTKWSR